MHVTLELVRLVELIFMPKIAPSRYMLIVLYATPKMLLKLG